MRLRTNTSIEICFSLQRALVVVISYKQAARPLCNRLGLQSIAVHLSSHALATILHSGYFRYLQLINNVQTDIWTAPCYSPMCTESVAHFIVTTAK